MLPNWLIVDRLDRELRALRSLEREAEGRAGPAHRRGVKVAHQAVVAAAQAVAVAADDVEGEAACVAWRSLAQARDAVGRALRALERHRRDRPTGVALDTAPQPGGRPWEGR
jgi:hypothetical protein